MLARRRVASSLVILTCSALLASAAMGSPDGLALAGTVVSMVWPLLAGGMIGSILSPKRSRNSHASPDKTEHRPSGADDLVGMLWDTLVLARSPRAIAGITPVDVAALISDVTRKFPNLAITFAGEPRALIARADAGALGHAFDILIDNACANGQRARVECDSGTSLLLVHIDDDGPGIPRGLRQRIFERQYYLSTPPSERPRCSAALVIAHQNARASGGDLSVGPSPLGGARFTLSLPLLGAEARHGNVQRNAVAA